MDIDCEQDRKGDRNNWHSAVYILSIIWRKDWVSLGFWAFNRLLTTTTPSQKPRRNQNASCWTKKEKVINKMLLTCPSHGILAVDKGTRHKSQVKVLRVQRTRESWCRTACRSPLKEVLLTSCPTIRIQLLNGNWLG